ncbi:MAG: DUF362 domain-containing protein [Sedimentisphaerales bacterium]|nr:DUF362 domain-containing protein [Sedimentisphaerales bacterium]
MKSEVYMATTEASYGSFPYDGRDDPVRMGLRRLWSAWGRDPEDPLGAWLRPGGTAVIKPNWVMDDNPLGHGIESLVTHTSLIRHMIYACASAMNGSGTVVVGDSPLQGCDFEALLRRSGMDELLGVVRREFPGLQIEVQDWRSTVLLRKGRLTGCPTFAQVGKEDVEYESVDLGRDSFLEEICEYARGFRVTMYPPSLMLAHHGPGKHQYLFIKRALEADLLINLPKFKTHVKTGVTGALKNLVGMCARKESLPHHIRGSYFDGGDDYCKSNVFSRWADRVYDDWWEKYANLFVGRRIAYSTAHRLLKAAAIATGAGRISGGSWSGNETLWRTVLDLNHAAYFGTKVPKQIITIVDGVIAGEGDGPVTPSPRPAGLLVGGEDPACIDAILTHVAGYNIARIPMVYHALTHRRSRFAGDLDSLRVVHADRDGQVKSLSLDQVPRLDFRKPRHWRRAAVPR